MSYKVYSQCFWEFSNEILSLVVPSDFILSIHISFCCPDLLNIFSISVDNDWDRIFDSENPFDIPQSSGPQCYQLILQNQSLVIWDSGKCSTFLKGTHGILNQSSLIILSHPFE